VIPLTQNVPTKKLRAMMGMLVHLKLVILLLDIVRQPTLFVMTIMLALMIPAIVTLDVIILT